MRLKFGSDYWNALRRKSIEKSKSKSAGFRARLHTWFAFWIKNCDDRCEECGEPVNRLDSDALYGAQAHILPKSEKQGFPSVADEIENHLTLGPRCGCHNRYDHSWSNAERMKVWPLAKERFRSFAHKIPSSEARRLPASLREIYDEIISSKQNQSHEQSV